VSEKLPVEKCNHRNLSFGSGSYYIFCTNCSHSWVCRAKESENMADICDGACSRRPNPEPVHAQFSERELIANRGPLLDALKPWANQMFSRYGHPVWLVGSALDQGWMARDVDVRVIFPNDEFEKRFGLPAKSYRRACWAPYLATQVQRLWDETAKMTRQGAVAMLMNLDFQIQPLREASLYFDKPKQRLDSGSMIEDEGLVGPDGITG
jgi:hypothetical protein